jgi:GTP-binding protein
VIEKRKRGSMISMENGKSMAYSIFNLQERGTMFIDAGTELYEGMII